MATIASLTVRIGASTEGFLKGMQKVENRARKTGSILQGTGTALSVGLTAPLLGAAGAALKMSNDMNASMANVATLIPGSTERVNELKASIQDMAIATGKATADLADGAYQVISAFGDTKDTVKILEINAKAAAAGLATTTDAINLTSAVTKGYGDTSAEAVQKVSDLAFQTVKLGQTTFPELAASMGRVTPLAASLGVSMEDMFGVMATATGVTGAASEVSTQLRGVLQSLMAPTADMTKLLESMGVESGQALLQQKGLKGTIDLLVNSANEAGMPLQKLIGSIEGQTLALALAGPQAAVFEDKLKAMADVAGATDEAFRAQTQGINKNGFALAQLQQKLTVTAQKAGDSLAPAFTKVLDAATPLVDKLVQAVTWFSNLDASTQQSILMAAGFVAALGPVLVVMGTAMKSIGALITVVKALGTALTFLAANPVILIIAAIAALVAAGVLLVKNWDKVKAFLVKTWDSIETVTVKAWGAIVEFLKAIGPKILIALTGPLGLILVYLVKHWDEIKAGFAGLAHAAVTWGSDMIQGFINGITGMVSRAWETASSFALGIADVVKRALGIASPSKVMATIGENVVEGLMVGIDSKKADLESATSAVIGGMEAAVRHLTDFMAGQAQIDVEKWLNKVGPEAVSAYKLAEATLSDLKDQLKEVGGALQDAQMSLLAQKNTLDRATAAVQKAERDYSAWEKVLGNVKTAIGKTESGIQALEESTKVSQDAIRSAFQDMGDFVADLENRINSADRAMRDLAGVKLAGEGALEDELFQLRQQENAIRLAINAAKRAGNLSTIPGLEKKLDAIGLEQERVQLEQTIQFEPLHRELQRMVDETKELGFDDAKAKIIAYQDQITDLTKEHSAAKTQMERLRASVADLIGETQKLTFDDAVAAVDKYRQILIDNAAKLLELQTVLSTQQTALELVTEAMTTLKTKLEDELIPAQTLAQEAYDKAKEVVDKLTAEQELLQSAVEKVRSGMDTMLGSIKDAASSLNDLAPAANSAALAADALASAARSATSALASVKPAPAPAPVPAAGFIPPPVPLENMLNVTPMADGGIVRHPTLAMLGEGSYPERVEPLKPGRESKPQTVIMPISIGGKVVEELVITGLDILVKQGRVASSVIS